MLVSIRMQQMVFKGQQISYYIMAIRAISCLIIGLVLDCGQGPLAMYNNY